MKKRIFMLAALAAGLVLCLAACGENNREPITITLWHVYGGEVNSPMNTLVDEFNRTVGQEQGIRVRVDSVSNSGVIHENVLAAAYKDPGAPELPDLFVSYPKTVLALPDENILADYHDYFTDEELDAYLPEFIEEGTVHDRLVVLPLAKIHGGPLCEQDGLRPLFRRNRRSSGRAVYLGGTVRDGGAICGMVGRQELFRP